MDTPNPNPYPPRPWGVLLPLTTTPSDYDQQVALWNTMLSRSIIPIRILSYSCHSDEFLGMQDFPNSLSAVTTILSRWAEYSSAHALVMGNHYQRWLSAGDPGVVDIFNETEKYMRFLGVWMIVEPVGADEVLQMADDDVQNEHDAAAEQMEEYSEGAEDENDQVYVYPEPSSFTAWDPDCVQPSRHDEDSNDVNLC